MSALPQVYASDAELAATDALRDSGKVSDSEYVATQTRQQQQFDAAETQGQQQQYRRSNDFARSQGSSTSQQQQQQQQSISPTSAQLSGSQSSRRHVQAPQSGIAPVPKEQQLHWRTIEAKGAHQYQGNTFAASMSQHLPTYLIKGHADGPQHIPNAESLSALPDAEHRQAWSTQPTFRWFKRSNYDGVADRWSQKEGLKGRGDSTYRPLSVKEQQEINARVERRKRLKGEPRTGEW